jgi:Domain of unknown function (DUF4221)
MKTIFFFAIIVALAGCGSEVEVSHNERLAEGKDSLSLVTDLDLTLPLDSVTVGFAAFFQYEPREDVLLLLNKDQRQIYRYDLARREVAGTIAYEEEGPNGLGYFDGFAYLNQDTILVFSKGTRKLVMFDSAGKVKSSLDLEAMLQGLGEKYFPFPAISIFHFQPVEFTKSRTACYFVGVQPGEYWDDDSTNRKVMLKYDLVNRTLKSFVPYPPIYNRSGINWGGQHFRKAHYALNSDDNVMVVSFPAAHELTVVRLDAAGDPASYRECYAGSRQIADIQSSSMLDYRLDKKKNFDYFLQTPSYGRVIYDQYRKLYYRVARLPIPEHKVKPGSVDKQVGLIILNRNLQKVGEVWFPNYTFSATTFFVRSNGLYLYNYKSNDDSLIFSRFLPTILPQ